MLVATSLRQGLLLPGLILACLLMPAVASGQNLEPRSYTNVPVGEHFIIVGGTRSEGDLAPTPSSPLQDAELTIDSLVVGYAHTLDFFGSSAKIGMAGARICYEGSAVFEGQFVEGRRCEYADPEFRFTWNFYGAPAMRLKEYMSWTPGLVLGASVQVTAPLGDYTSRQLINAGTNRWMIRPGLGMSYKRGNWHFDLMGSVKFFENNDDFFRGARLSQDPLYHTQFHIIYSFRNRSWLSLNGNFYRGGESEINGASQDDYLENSRWGLTYNMPFGSHHTVKVYASTGVVTRIGSDFDTYGVGWQYRF